MNRWHLLSGVIGASAIALVMAVADSRLQAQSEPLLVYDLGLFCLYAVDNAGVWGTSKSAVGLADSDPCPRPRR